MVAREESFLGGPYWNFRVFRLLLLYLVDHSTVGNLGGVCELMYVEEGA